MFSYQLARSARRKTLAISIKQGQVFVRAPVYLSQYEIDQFIAQKANWIATKLKQSIVSQALNHTAFTHDSDILITGNQKRIKYRSPQDHEVIFEGDNVCLDIGNDLPHQTKIERAKDLLLTFYHQKTIDKISVRLAYWIELTKLSPKSYKIRKYKSRWGSCNSRQELTFNSLLAMMPDDTIDYIIVHELCHLQHLNHSTDFWQLVAQYMPDYKNHKAWIKQHERSLSVFH